MAQGYDVGKLNKYIHDSVEIWQDKMDKVPVYQLGCTIGSHIGHGAIGVAFFEK